MISNGKPTPEARLKEEKSARDKKRMRRRLKRQEEREARESAVAVDDSEESESEEEEEEAEEGWDTETDGSMVDVEDALVKQFESVGIRSRVKDSGTPVRAMKNGKSTETPARRVTEETKTHKGFMKTPLRESSKPTPQSWDALVATPSGKTSGGGAKVKGTPRMTPARTPGGAGSGAADDTVPVQGGDRALRYLTPRPCHK